MSILSILSLVLPMVTKIGSLVIERIWKSKYTSLVGTTAGASIFGILSSYGCDISQFDKMVVSVMMAMPGLLATDPRVSSSTIPDVIVSTIQSSQISSDNM